MNASGNTNRLCCDRLPPRRATCNEFRARMMSRPWSNSHPQAAVPSVFRPGNVENGSTDVTRCARDEPYPEPPASPRAERFYARAIAATVTIRETKFRSRRRPGSCGCGLRRHCGVGESSRTLAMVRYHQARNADARKSRLRRRKKYTKMLLAL